MEAPSGSGKNPCESQGSLSMELSPEQTPSYYLLHSQKRKLLPELDLDDTGGGSSTKKGKSPRELNVAAQRWIIFRMMLPASSDGCIDLYNLKLKPTYEKDNVDVDFYEAGDEIGIVMVSAKEDSRCSSTHAVRVFRALYCSFLLHMRFKGKFLIRLLVPAGHTKRLIVLQTINSQSCKPVIYLTDNVSFLSLGDVIVEVEAEHRHIDEAMRSVCSDLGEFRVDQSMVSELKATNGIHPSARGCGSGVRCQRTFEVWASKPIPLLYIDLIIGKDGANVENIRKSSPASVYLKPYTLREVTLCIVGESYDEVEAAKNAMEDLIPEDRKKDGKRVFAEMVPEERIVSGPHTSSWEKPYYNISSC